MQEAPLIDIRNATVWRGSTRVLDNFSLLISRHERVAVLGPNGAGKTTLLKTITRELYPVHEAGSWIRVLGRETWNVWELRAHIGLVSHDLQAGFIPEATATEVVLSGYFSSIGMDRRQLGRVNEKQRERARKVLLELGIEMLGSREFRTLSTGQQRRCLLGRALVHDPDTLVFDEPTAGLDMSASFELLAQVRQLVNRGRSLVWVTHHLNDIPPEVERVIVLKDGAIVADGAKHEVLNRDLLSKVYETELRLAEVDGYYLAYPGPG